MKKVLLLVPVLAINLLVSCSKGMLQKSNPHAALAGKSHKSLSALSGNIYYVDPSGSDSNNGLSSTTPWQTIAKVSATTFSPGDQILFKAGGVWSGNLAPQGSGSSGSPIVIDMYGTGSNPIINGGGLTNGSVTVALNNQSYWQINNLEITNTVASGLNYAVTGIRVNNSNTAATSDITIQNCYIHNVNSTGVGTANYNKGTGGIIFTGLINNILVTKCHVADCDMEGIRTSSPDPAQANNVVFDSNLIENIAGDGIVLHGVTNSKITNNVLKNVCKSDAANFAGCWTWNSTGTIIAHNEISGITGGGIYDGEPFDADENTNGDIFEYNYTHDNARGFMLFMPDASNIIVRYNMSVNDANSSSGGSKFFNYTSNSTTNKIYNNTFYTSGTFTRIFEYTNTSSSFSFNSMFSNNIFYAAGSVPSFSDRPISSSAVFQNNCFYPASLTATNGPAGTVSGNIIINPGFVNAGAHAAGLSSASAYNLITTSPCLNAGVAIASNGGYDYFQNTLPGGSPDIGASQHQQTYTSIGFAPTADTYVRDGSYANTNYGTTTTLVVKSDAASYARRAYGKFDFSSVTASQVQSAVLTLYVSAENTDPTRIITVYKTNTENWGETTMTWNNAPTDTTYVGTIQVGGIGRYTLNVTAAINAQLQKPDHLVSFLLINKGAFGSTNDVQFGSREATSNNPRLTLNY